MTPAHPLPDAVLDLGGSKARIGELTQALRDARHFIADEADRRGIADATYDVTAESALRAIDAALAEKGFVVVKEDDHVIGLIARSIGRTIHTENHRDRAIDVIRSLRERDNSLPLSSARSSIGPERQPSKLEVAGSNPAGRTTEFPTGTYSELQDEIVRLEAELAEAKKHRVVVRLEQSPCGDPVGRSAFDGSPYHIERHLKLIGTGQDFEGTALFTVVDGDFVWHVIEVAS